MRFEDLKFHPHEAAEGCYEARMFFRNGFGAQVEGGPLFQEDGINTFQVSVLQGDERDNDIVDIVSNATRPDVEAVLNEVSNEAHPITDPSHPGFN